MRPGLERAIELGAHCKLCPLSGDAGEGPVWGEQAKHGKHRLTVVGEAPGRNEVFAKRPFMGRSGAALWHELQKRGVQRSECHVTNAALCRGDGGDKEAAKAAECCAPRLLRELAEVNRGYKARPYVEGAGGLALAPSKPPIVVGEVSLRSERKLSSGFIPPIVTLGKLSTFAILNVKALFMARGFIWTAKDIHFSIVQAAQKKAQKAPVDKRPPLVLKAETLSGRRKMAGVIVLPSVHPAFVLRSDVWAPILRLDLDRAVRLINGKIDVNKLEDKAPHKIGGPELLKKLGKSISLDVETDGIDPHQCKLLCVGMSDGAHTVVLWPWSKSWAKPLTAFLRTRTEVVCHNGNYDRVVLENHGVR